MWRKGKGQHLSLKHKSYICRLLRDFHENHNSIQVVYRLSKFTYNKLNKTKNTLFNSDGWDIQDIFDICPISSDAQKFIANLVKPTTTSTTIRKIYEAVQDGLGEKYSIHIIKSYLKNILRYNFKKAWLRPPKYVDAKIKITKGLFCSELLKMIYNQQPIFSFDEWSITRAMKTKYSWLPVGKSPSVINDFWEGSASLIMIAGSIAQ